jgi:acetaldehyde dehydrogenase
MAKVKAAIIGSGNIGTDLMIKIMRQRCAWRWAPWWASTRLSDGLARAQRLGVATTHEGIEGLQKLPMSGRTSASSSTPPRRARTSANSDPGQAAGKVMIDLTPAAIGPY